MLWTEGYVEPIIPPPLPRHVAAQQLLALCLQEGQVGLNAWKAWFDGLPLATPGELDEIAAWLVRTGHLDQDSGMLFVGPAAERRFGQKHFLELLSVFTSAPEFIVLNGRNEIGSVDPMALTRRLEGPRILSLAGRSWVVSHTDWKRRRAFVEPSELRGDSRWSGFGSPISFAVSNAMRRALLDSRIAGVDLSKRAIARLAGQRTSRASTVHPEATVVMGRGGREVRWWTWAGARANALLAAALASAEPGLVGFQGRFDNRSIRLADDASAPIVAKALRQAVDRFGQDFSGVVSPVADEALKQLRFSELLPAALATTTLAARAVDHAGGQTVVALPLIDRE